MNGGARITAVEGAAVRAGLRVGDVIVAVANTEVTTTTSANKAIEMQDKTKAIAMQIRRGERGAFVLVKPEPTPAAAAK